MPTTPNYGWDIPTPAGDDDVWGQIINEQGLTQVDETLQGLDDRVAILEAPVLMEPLVVLASSGKGFGWAATALGVTGMLHSSGFGSLIIPVPIRAGQRVTSVTVRGEDPSGVATFGLAYQSASGTNTSVGSAIALPTAIDNATIAMSHVALAEKAYYVFVTPPAAPNGTYVVQVYILIEAA